MGVPQFFSFLRKRYREAIQTEIPGRVSSLAIDMNSLFHQAAGLVYGYVDDESMSSYQKKQRLKDIAEADPETLKMELFFEIWNRLVTILNQVRPNDTIIIAVDGMAPMAKIQQQRQRRYKSAR